VVGLQAKVQGPALHVATCNMHMHMHMSHAHVAHVHVHVHALHMYMCMCMHMHVHVHVCVRLERCVQLAGATPRLAAPLGIVVRDEVPVQDCGIVRVLDLRP